MAKSDGNVQIETNLKGCNSIPLYRHFSPWFDYSKKYFLKENHLTMDSQKYIQNQFI